MINARMDISHIDYEKSLANLFPAGMKKCSEIENPGMAVRFLKKMGESSMTAALGIMNLMTQKGKGELLCALVNLYRLEIQTALAAYLKENELGKNVRLGDIFLFQDLEGHLALSVYDIKINYSGLADNAQVQNKIKDIAGNMVGNAGSMISKIGWLKEAAADGAGLAAKAAAKLAPDEVEKLGISVLEKPQNKKKLLAWMDKILAEKGLCLTLEDCIFSQEQSPKEQHTNVLEIEKVGFSEELEEELMNAVVRYLKVLLKE